MKKSFLISIPKVVIFFSVSLQYIPILSRGKRRFVCSNSKCTPMATTTTTTTEAATSQFAYLVSHSSSTELLKRRFILGTCILKSSKSSKYIKVLYKNYQLLIARFYNEWLLQAPGYWLIRKVVIPNKIQVASNFLLGKLL